MKFIGIGIIDTRHNKRVGRKMIEERGQRLLEEFIL
jgi:hypothetical protein